MVSEFEVYFSPFTNTVAPGTVYVPGLLARSTNVNVMVIDLFTLPFIMLTLELREVDGPIRTSKSGISGALKSLHS